MIRVDAVVLLDLDPHQLHRNQGAVEHHQIGVDLGAVGSGIQQPYAGIHRGRAGAVEDLHGRDQDLVGAAGVGDQEGIRNILADCLRAVVAQQLMPRVGGGRVAAIKILFSSAAIGNMIREGKTAQITSAIPSPSRSATAPAREGCTLS